MGNCLLEAASDLLFQFESDPNCFFQFESDPNCFIQSEPNYFLMTLFHSTSHLFSGLVLFTEFAKAIIASVLYFVWTRVGDAGCCTKLIPVLRSVFGRIGRGTKPPPQLGHTLLSRFLTQPEQKVHS